MAPNVYRRDDGNWLVPLDGLRKALHQLRCLHGIQRKLLDAAIDTHRATDRLLQRRIDQQCTQTTGWRVAIAQLTLQADANQFGERKDILLALRSIGQGLQNVAQVADGHFLFHQAAQNFCHTRQRQRTQGFLHHVR